MSVTKSGMFIFLSVFGFSIFIANVLSLISITGDNEQETTSGNLKLPSITQQRMLQISDSSDHLMWFVQVSDLHLSMFHDKTRGTDLLELCDFTFKHINPSVILATGDLTDARKLDQVSSMQFKEEWVMYKEILNKCNTIKKIPWLDIRGNHDNFDVPDIYSPKNLFRKYSIQGRNNSRSYVHKLTVGSEKYAFVGVDACPDVGIKMTFNYGGVLSNAEVARLHGFKDTLKNTNFTIWFGHYPTSCIISQQPEIKSIIASDQNSMAYLCGHLHTLFDLVPNMYSLQKSGFYELELADWKKKRMYRVAAIDHGLFSFVDMKHNDWPVILVTNPKHALFQSPSREPLGAMLSSTHIRVLVFSPGEIHSVRISIDSGPWNHASHVSGPLFVITWNPSNYSSGIHNIYVAVLDTYGHEKIVTHPFSLDGTRLQFRIIPRLLLMLKFNTILQVLFGLTVSCYVLPYCYLRYLNKQVLDGKKQFACLKKNTFFHRWLKRLWVLSNINSLFYPIFLYPLYISIGPWAIAELLEGQYGIIFIWGIFVNGTYIADSFTYMYAFLQLFLFHGPIILFTAYSLDKRLLEHSLMTSQNKILWALKSSTSEIPYLVLLLTQLLMVYAFYLAYGPLAVLFGPFRVWPVILIIWNWYHSKTLPLHKVKAAARAWERQAKR